MEEEQVRLSKIMSERGMCSRREADRYIEAGKVLVDGQIMAVLGTKVSPKAIIEFLPAALNQQNAKVTLLLNKPIGYVSTQPEKNYSPAIDLITPENQERVREDSYFQFFHRQGLSVVGRLDIDSKGLLVFTQDGTLVKQLIGPEARVPKEYLVRVEGDVTNSVLRALSSGLFLDGKPLKPAKVKILEPNLLRVILIEGKKRQIRRMCEQVDLQVTHLKRVRIGNVRLGDLPEGKWRYLRPGEVF